MLYREYENFDELFKNITPEIINNPSLFDFSTGVDAFIKDLVIKTNTPECSIRLDEIGYQLGKWSMLLGKYFDEDRWIKYKEDLKTVTGNTFTYRFNYYEHRNGPCIIAFVLTRYNGNKPWTGLSVEYRTTQLNQRFGADLVMLNRMINDLPQDICNIENVVFYVPQAYISAMYTNALGDTYFGLDYSKLDQEHPWVRYLCKRKHEYFDKDSPPYEKYASIHRLQDFYTGRIKYEPIYIEDLSLYGNKLPIISNKPKQESNDKNILW